MACTKCAHALARFPIHSGTSLIGNSSLAKVLIKLSSSPSTMTLSLAPNGYDPEHSGVRFILGGKQREISLLELGWRVDLYLERKSRENVILNGLSRAETVKASHLLMEFWPNIMDGGFNVGNIKVASIRNPKVICNILYWLAKYLKGVREKNLICRGVFMTRIARSFGLLTNEMIDALSVEPLSHIFKKKSIIAIGVVMELHNGACFWLATLEVEEDDEAAEGEAGNERTGGSADMYRNMSQGDCQGNKKSALTGRVTTSSASSNTYPPVTTWIPTSRSYHSPDVKPVTLPMATMDTCLQAMSTVSAPLMMAHLFRKERVKPRRVRAMAMTIQYGVIGMTLAAQSEAFMLERAEVYYECREPFKSLKCLWFRSKSIAATWLEKVVTPLIEPAIKSFTAASAVLKPKSLKVDRHTLGWHLEKIHVTWAHLEKKRIRLRLYTKSFEETVHTERGDGVAITKRRRQDFHIDDVMNLASTSERS
uniref:Uncharacterized protein n=1 Tax=Tanacetum cinerariifolium TaxID=118510 RepID=A0A6L2P453_TANCI|nr:hypothetical protein [Tanacetum cinerariifolium]